MTICPSHRAKLGIVSSRSCSTRGRVPGHGKEKESGQKVKEDWGKRVVNPVVNKYHLIVRGLFKNFKAPTITITSEQRELVIMVGGLKFENKPLTIRWYLSDS